VLSAQYEGGLLWKRDKSIIYLALEIHTTDTSKQASKQASQQANNLATFSNLRHIHKQYFGRVLPAR